MPSGVEQYGQTAGLGETTITRLQTGFDEIRTNIAWASFKIPAYVWQYIDSNDRDWIIDWIETALFTTRSAPLDPLDESVTQESVFAFMYTLFIFQEWWHDNPDRPYGDDIDACLLNDVGIPDSACLFSTKDSVRYWYNYISHPSANSNFKMNSLRFNYGYNPGVGGLRWGSYCEAKAGSGTNHVTYQNAYDGSPIDTRNYMRDTHYPTAFYYEYNTYWDDVGDETTEWGELETRTIPTGYGEVCQLDETTLTRLQTGFAEIRAISGWEYFQIPDSAWTYVGQRERDRFLAWLQTALWTTRTEDLPVGSTKEMHLAFCYVLLVLSEWWVDNDSKPTMPAMFASLSEDWGIPGSAITLEDDYGTNNGMELGIAHPSGVSTLDTDYFWIVDSPPEAWDDSYVFLTVGVGTLGTIEYCQDTDEGEYCYLLDSIVAVEDYDANWDDIGVVEDWSSCSSSSSASLIFANETLSLLSGRALFKTFGLMEGKVVLAVELDIGDTITVTKGATTLFVGVVTSVQANLVDGTFTHEIADPVSAKGGTVEFTSGEALDALQEAIENCGGTFESEISTEVESSGEVIETVVYTGEPIDAWQFFRAVSYALGGTLRYGRDGVYRLIVSGSGETLSEADIVAGDGVILEENNKDYANKVTASMNEEWQEDAIANTEESFSGGGGTAVIIRFGEQILEQSVDFSGGEGGTDIEYEYDSLGYRISISESREGAAVVGSEKITRETVFSDISEDGNQYAVSVLAKTYRYEFSPISETYGWIQNKETSQEWEVNLEGLSTVVEIEKGTANSAAGATMNRTYIIDEEEVDVPTTLPICAEDFPGNWPYLWNQNRWIASIVSNPTAGPLEGTTTCAHYMWAPKSLGIENSWYCSHMGWIRSAGQANKSYSIPKLEMYAPVENLEVHIIAKAEDPNSIASLGEHEYECQAVALETETAMQAFALGVLNEKALIRKASMSIPMNSLLPHDILLWRGLEWPVEQVTVDCDRACDVMQIKALSNLGRLSMAVNKEPVTYIDDLKNVITKRTSQYENVARGRIIAQLGFRRYSVQVEGKAEPIEARALSDDSLTIGGTVLLIRPTGKTQPWTLFNLSQEQEIQMPETVQENITPAVDPFFGLLEFTADITDPIPDEIVTLSWDFLIPAGWLFSRVVIDDGTGTETEITAEETKSLEVSYDRTDGVTFLPSLVLYLEDANGQELELDPRELDDGYLVLNHMDLEVTPDWEEPWTGLSINFAFSTQTTGEDILAITSLKARADSGDAWDSLLTTDTSVDYSYATAGSYTMQVELIYENSRSETETLLVEVPVTVWEASANLEGDVATFPVDGAFDETWLAGDIGESSPYIEGVGVLADAKGIGGTNMDFTLSFGVAGTGISTGKYTEIRLGVSEKYRPVGYGETDYVNYTYMASGFPIPVFTFFQVEAHADGLRAWAGYRLGDNYRKWIGPIILATPSYPATISGTFKVVYTAPAGGADGSMEFFWDDVSKGSKVIYTTGTQQLFSWSYGTPYVLNPVPPDARLFTLITRAQSGLALDGNVRLIIPETEISITEDWEEFLLPGSPKEFVWVSPY